MTHLLAWGLCTLCSPGTWCTVCGCGSLRTRLHSACWPPVPFSCAPGRTAQTGPGNTPVIFVYGTLSAFLFTLLFLLPHFSHKTSISYIYLPIHFSYKFHFELEKLILNFLAKSSKSSKLITSIYCIMYIISTNMLAINKCISLFSNSNFDNMKLFT